MNESNKKIPPFLISVRCLLTIMAFLGYCIQYMLKINMGMAIVCMVNNTALKSNEPLVNHYNNNTNLSNETKQISCLFQAKDSHNLDGPFIWNKKSQGLILASYFYGYIITQVPGGWLSAKYGGVRCLCISNLLASIFTIVTPWCARWGFVPVFICRFLLGITHGAFWPAMSSIFVYWAPKLERTKMLGTSTAGAWVGNIIALPLSGYLCLNGFDSGWPSIFYIFGIASFIWSVVFILVITDSPKNHRFISKLEQDYLLEETKNEVSAKEKGPLITPWKQIFMSKVCWATFVAHFSNNWGNYLYLTQLPSFMKDVLKFDIKSNGAMSAIPYIACATFTASLGIFSDILIRNNILTRRNLRRIFNFIGLFIPAVFVIALSFVTCSLPYLGVAFLTIGLAFNGFYWSAGPLVNINDIAGSFSGVVFGITNTFGTMPGIICPYIVGVLTQNRSQKEWQNVFIICAVIYAFGAVFYFIFSDSVLQPWAKIEDKKKTGIDNPAQVLGDDEFELKTKI